MATEVLTTAVLLTISILCFTEEWGMTVSACVDITTHIPCSGVPFLQPANNRVCYKTEISDEPCGPESCEAIEIAHTNQPIEFTHQQSSKQAKIWSPGNLQGSYYQNKRLCRYHAACPPGFFMYYSWIEGSFILEDANPSVGCLDYLQIEAGTSGATIPYKCGYQTAFSDVTSMPIKMEFRSNTKKRYLGFQIDILCVNSQLSETMTTTGGGLTIEGKVTNRGGDPLTVGCQELPDPNENIRTPPSFTIPQSGSRVDIPREAFIEYQDNILMIVAEGNVLRTFEKVYFLFFQTGYNGTQTLSRSAPAGIIYGGGVLRIFLSVAYYITDRIPPQLEPNSLERNIIGILLNATKPFFVGEVGPTNTPGHTKLYTDPRIDLQALTLAQKFQSACNIFLREAARSYLNMLDELKISPPFNILG